MIEILRQETPEGFIHSLCLRPAYETEEAHHGMEMWWVCQRGKVAVEVQWMTPFFLKETREIYRQRGWKNMPFDGLGGIHYHSPFPQYEGQTPDEKCTYTGGACYAGSSFTGGTDFFNKIVEKPEEFWPLLDAKVKEIEEKNALEAANQRNFS